MFLLVFQAKNLFLKGIEYEQSRKFYEAIQFYKRAVQLVPDIEVRLYESTKTKAKDRFEDDSLDALDNDFTTTDDSEQRNEPGEEETDLSLKLSKIVNRNHCVCFPKFEQDVSISVTYTYVMSDHTASGKKSFYRCTFYRRPIYLRCRWK